VQGGDEGGGPFISAFSQGQAGCSGNPPLGPNDCDSWEQILNTGDAASWDLDEEVGLTIAGGSMAATGTANAIEQDNADGTLGSLTLTATMEATLTGGGNGSARLDFQASFPIASESISVIGQASVEGHGTAIIGGSGDIQVTVGCAEEDAVDVSVQVLGGAHGGEAGRLNDEVKSQPISATVVAEPQSNGSRFCSMRVFMDATANTNRPNDGSEHGSGKATISISILAGGAVPSAAPSAGDCALAGTAFDGDAAIDLHANPLSGVRVELLRNDAVVGQAVPTDQDGHYCLPWEGVPQVAPRSPEPGPYELRVTLIDAVHEPPVFHTEHESLQQPISARYDLTDADWGTSEVELVFTKTDAQPWLSDVAVIHWESARFVDWILDVLLVPPADLAGLKVRAYSSVGTSYVFADKLAHVSAADSPYAQRSTALSGGPENDEWHEIGHHLGPVLGIAPSRTAPTCAGRVNHGGWTNWSTCDSLSEAFAMYLSVVGSLELDAGRAGGYATPQYAGFGSSDDNDYPPWSFEIGSNAERIYREDLGVARLLWDLGDDTAAESKPSVVVPRSGGNVAFATLRDRVALGHVNLIQLLKMAGAHNVADIHDFLTTNPVVDAALRTPDVDLDGDGTADISPIDEVFLLHDFRALGVGAYQVGDPIGHTQPGGFTAPLTDRRHIDTLPGSVVRLRNTGAGLATFTIALTSESGASTFTIPVGPGRTLDLELSMGPYWTEFLAADAGLPACGAEGERASTMAVSGPGGVSRSVTACEYAHLVVEADDGAALTLEAAGSEAVPSGTPGAIPGSSPGDTGTIVLIVGLVALVLVIAGGALLFARGRRGVAP
jgi:hypothetical protein